MRPRIHHPFFAEIAMLDAVATRTETGPATITSGFDDDFGEIVVVTSSGARQSERLEQPSIFVPSQIEDTMFDLLRQLMAGAQLDTKLTLVWAAKDLAAMDLIYAPTGEPLVRTSDRLVSIRDRCMNVIETIRTPPGLYVSEVKPCWGIAQRRDLFLVSFEDRKQGA